MIHFEIPKNQSSIIKVIGVGGGGGNAVNYMHSLGIEGVDFVVCNTDSQALALSPIANKIQLGPHLTQGLGAGANPEIGKQSCEESLEDVTKILKVNTRMAFITAGMGGGTGTGGAPVVSKICRDLGILTVGIVTTPFTYEGRKRMKQAQEGIARMQEHVDTILIISNDKLRQQFGNLPFTQAFAKADDILATAAKCITDVITSTGQINVDFADVCTVMKNGGVAILGSASCAGEHRALQAVEEALSSPLLNDSDIRGAKWILLNITSAAGEFEHTMDEAEAIQAYVQQMAGDYCDVILGMGHDPNLKEKIAVTVIATGFNHNEINAEFPMRKAEPEKVVVSLDKQVVAEVAAPAPAPAFVPVDLTPTLMVEPVAPVAPVVPVAVAPVTIAPVVVEEPKAVAPVVAVDATQHFLQLVEEQPAPEPVFTWQDTRAERQEEPVIQLVIKNEEPAKAPEPVVMKIGERILSADEVEEKRRFEEQKRALEERAERLRRMSFNIKENQTPDDIENVPAYMRKNMKLDNGVSSSDSFYSGYTVGHNDQNNSHQASIQTINTFLDGKKPD
jgi:cell division protein FtsZ